MGKPSLETMIGEKLNFSMRWANGRRQLVAKLLAVENGGVWIESQVVTDDLLKLLNVPASPRQPVLFVPFAAIECIVSSVEGPALSASSFGLAPDAPHR